ncbi:MAG: hypothetical protein HN348_27650, partial [Proteobacteria bacterium]|nr:hypothetical protein [Pseudomonadota bacterium]
VAGPEVGTNLGKFLDVTPAGQLVPETTHQLAMEFKPGVVTDPVSMRGNVDTSICPAGSNPNNVEADCTSCSWDTGPNDRYFWYDGECWDLRRYTHATDVEGNDGQATWLSAFSRYLDNTYGTVLTYFPTCVNNDLSHCEPFGSPGVDDGDRMAQIESFLDNGLPVVFHRPGHYMVLRGYDPHGTPNMDDDEFLINDPWHLPGNPASGDRTMSFADFTTNYFSGRMMVLSL